MKKENNEPDWVRNAASQPIAFSQVREDAFQDQWVVQQIIGPSRILMIASGGCTSAFLATMPQINEIQLVDPNPAQMALARLKLELLRAFSPQKRLQILGHEKMSMDARKKELIGLCKVLRLPHDIFGSLDEVSRKGPDFAGRYEAVFEQLRKILAPSAKQIAQLLQETDLVEQSQKLHSHLEAPLKKAFSEVMALPYLVRLFGAEATRNSVEPFALHFFHRTCMILQTVPALGNPYLAQVLLGQFTGGVYYPWLLCDSPAQLPTMSFETTSMVLALEKNIAEGKTYHFVHLSNILDWLSPEDVEKTLLLAFKILEPKGYVLIRQLNSNLNIRQWGHFFSWQEEASQRLHQRDRSYFYRAIHLGQKL